MLNSNMSDEHYSVNSVSYFSAFPTPSHQAGVVLSGGPNYVNYELQSSEEWFKTPVNRNKERVMLRKRDVYKWNDNIKHRNDTLKERRYEIATRSYEKANVLLRKCDVIVGYVKATQSV